MARETRKLPIFQDVYSLVMFNILSPEAEAGYYFNVGFDSFGIFANSVVNFKEAVSFQTPAFVKLDEDTD